MDTQLVNTIKAANQEQVLKFVDQLDAQQLANFEAQLAELDFAELNKLAQEYVINKPVTHIPSNLTPPEYFPAVPKNAEQAALYEKAYKHGEELIANNRVCCLTVAGGQGTRLGFDGPKGTYPIGPVTGKSLFNYFADNIYRTQVKYNATIAWYIMTSPVNDADTRKFFEENNYFNLSKDQIFFFTQGTMPAFDLNGKLLLADYGSLSLSPNGHGGTLLALRKSGALADMQKRNADIISYFQVDNPLVPVANPLFIGLHDLEQSQMSAVMLAKTGPKEKLGNFCVSNGRLQIIEYSDLPDELAEKRNSDGSLAFVAGSPAIHVISRDFVAGLTEGNSLKLPWHRADKKIPYIDDNGSLVKPEEPNGVKLESFIFDALPLATRTMILECKREDVFGPTKNPTGVDSVESCRDMLVDRDARRLAAAGVVIPRKSDGSCDCRIELSAKVVIDNEDAIAYCKAKNLVAIAPGESVYLD
jgi:UDP-N-acetylglucosamine/UDP-N-acetylgalactosamine diphosphorylase